MPISAVGVASVLEEVEETHKVGSKQEEGEGHGMDLMSPVISQGREADPAAEGLSHMLANSAHVWCVCVFWGSFSH